MLGATFVITPQATSQSTGDCPDYVDSPLWIPELSFDLVSGSEDSYVDGRAAFVNPGDQIRVDFDVVNRVPENCDDFMSLGPPVNKVEVQRWLNLDGHDTDGTWVYADAEKGRVGPTSSDTHRCQDLAEPGETCPVRDFITIPEDGIDDGEYIIRFVAGNAGNEWRALAGIERVIVVGLTPDLDAEELRSNQDDLATTYGTADLVGFQLNVTNDGDYPNWNPNAGELYWGRSPYDAENGDGGIDVCLEYGEKGCVHKDTNDDTHESCLEDGECTRSEEIDDFAPDQRPVYCLGDDMFAWNDGGDDKAGDKSAGESAPPGPSRWCTQDHNPEDDEHRSSPFWRFDEREATYEVTQVSLPPCIGDGDFLENNAAPWTEVLAGGSDSVETSDLVCSYRRGAPLNMPLHYEVTDPETSTVIESGVIPSGTFQGTPQSMSEDKDDAILPEEERSIDVNLFDTHYKAGDHEVTVRVGHDGDDWDAGPELDHGDNDASGDVNIEGVDLQITETSVFVQAEGAGPSCGVSPDNPCPVDGLIHLSVAYENVGDDTFDGDAYDPQHDEGMDRCNGRIDNEEFSKAGEPNPRDRCWTAAPYLNGEVVRFDNRGIGLIVDEDGVPGTDADATSLWGQTVQIAPDDDGGLQSLEVRLDHPDTYDEEGVQVRDVGKVAEKTENNECQTSQDDLDNVWCIPLYFEDTTVPVVHDVAIEAPRSDGDTPAAHEGEDLTFIANVTDNSLEHVNATFDLPNGTTEEMPMDPPDGPGSNWTLTRNFTNVTGEVGYTFTAIDAFGHTVEPDQGLNATILELPKAADVKALEVNGHDLTHDHEHEPPAYEGTASEPENWIRVEANITGTGQDDPYATDGKNVTIHDRTETLRYDVPVGVYTVCDIWNTVTDEQEATGEGDECEGSTGDQTTEIRNKRPLFFIDTRCDEDEDPEEHAGDCQSVSQDLREAWERVEIDWAGSFNVSVSVTDVFNRTKNTTSQAALADVDDEPTLEVLTLGPGEIDPGDQLQAAARATDGLQVERVHLEAEQPNGTNATFDLTLDPDKVEDSETKNGTYKLQLTTGAFEDLEQAGTYNVTLVATDLAGKENHSQPVEVTIVDEAAPEIASFTSVPAEVQELGGPLSWEAEITDATAIKSAVVTVERPTSGTTTHALAYNDTTDQYELPEPIEANGADLGNWTYTLNVEDWAGNAAEASGYVLVVENLPPQVTRWTPSVEDDDGAFWGPADPTIRADLVDFGDGVDKSTIEMTVDDDPVSPEISEIDHGYRLSYALGDDADLSHGDTVTVRVTAADRSTPDPLVAENITHEFSIDAQSPSATIDAAPSLLDGTRMIVGPDSEFTLTIQDAGAGAGPSQALLSRLAGGAVEAQEETEVDPGIPFTLDAFGDAYIGAGDYRLEITPVDAVGNEGDASSPEVTVDDAGPSVTVFPKPGEPPEKVFADITDTSRVESAEIHYTADGTAGDPVPMEEVDGTWQGEIPSFRKNTTVAFHVQAVDFFGNLASSEEMTFNAGDKLPEISITAPREGEVLSGTTTVSWQASDTEVDDSELTVSLYYREDGAEAFTPIAGAQQIANTGSHTLDTIEIPNGQVTLQAIVTDGTSFGDDQVVVQVRNLDALFEAPGFEDAPVEDGKARLAPGSDAVFTVGLRDQARAVWANVTQGGQTLASHELEAGGDGQWRGTITTPEEPGTYEIDLTALTADGPTETPGAYTFEVASDTGGVPGTMAAWVLLSALFAGALLVGTVGLGRKW